MVQDRRGGVVIVGYEDLLRLDHAGTDAEWKTMELVSYSYNFFAKLSNGLYELQCWSLTSLSSFV